MKKGSIRFYSTAVSPEKSLAEVATLLREYGAKRFEQMWDDDGHTVAVRFNLPTPEARFGFMPIILRPKVDALANALRQRHRVDDNAQVYRVAWRQLKGVLEGILMAADSGMFSAAQVLLGMAETPDGEPLWAVIQQQDVLALPSGEPPTIEADWEEV